MRKFIGIAVAALFAAGSLSVYAADNTAAGTAAKPAKQKKAPAAAPADKNLKYESSVGESQAGHPANANPHTEDAKYQSSVGEKGGGAPVAPTSAATEPIKVQSDAGKPLGQGSPPATTAKKK